MDRAETSAGLPILTAAASPDREGSDLGSWNPSPAIMAVRAPVAQWIERRPPEPKVAGSNPVGRAISTFRAAPAPIRAHRPDA